MSIMMKNLLLAPAFIALCSSAFAESDYEPEKYVQLDMVASCSGEGQVKLVYTNVSGQLLLVHPYYVEEELFDPAALAVALFDEQDDEVKLVRKKQLSFEGEVERYAPLTPGQVVEHVIDFNDYLESDIDKSKRYTVTFTFGGEVVTENGDIHVVKDLSTFLGKDHTIEPTCWQE